MRKVSDDTYLTQILKNSWKFQKLVRTKVSWNLSSLRWSLFGTPTIIMKVVWRFCIQCIRIEVSFRITIFHISSTLDSFNMYILFTHKMPSINWLLSNNRSSLLFTFSEKINLLRLISTLECIKIRYKNHYSDWMIEFRFSWIFEK